MSYNISNWIHDMRVHGLVGLVNQHITHLFLFEVTHLLVYQVKLIEVLEFGTLVLSGFYLTVDYDEFLSHFGPNVFVRYIITYFLLYLVGGQN